MNPVNVAQNVYSKNLADQAKHLKDLHQNLSHEMDIQQLTWKRVPSKSYFTSLSKAAPCLSVPHKNVWNSVNNRHRSCKRFIGRMSHCFADWKVRDFETFEEKDRADSKILGYTN